MSSFLLLTPWEVFTKTKGKILSPDQFYRFINDEVRRVRDRGIAVPYFQSQLNSVFLWFSGFEFFGSTMVLALANIHQLQRSGIELDLTYTGGVIAFTVNGNAGTLSYAWDPLKLDFIPGQATLTLKGGKSTLIPFPVKAQDILECFHRKVLQYGWVDEHFISSAL